MTGHQQIKTKVPWYHMSDEAFVAIASGSGTGVVAALLLILAICV